MKYTQGGFTFQDLKNMPIGEYNALKYSINLLVASEEEEMEKQKEEAKEATDKMRRSLGKGKGIGMKI